jgi:ssDNA-binding Zn-finger/Zn-ribbon topoisomerase 1
MTYSSSGTSLLDTDRQSRRHDPVYVLSAACPLCHGTLALRQTRDGRRYYIACARRPCDYTAAYDPVLEQLRNRIARLEAELEFTRLQTKLGEARHAHLG